MGQANIKVMRPFLASSLSSVSEEGFLVAGAFKILEFPKGGWGWGLAHANILDPKKRYLLFVDYCELYLCTFCRQIHQHAKIYSITRMHQFIATKVAFIASQPGQQFYRTDFPLEVIFVFLFFFIAFFFIGPFFFFTGQENLLQ